MQFEWILALFAALASIIIIVIVVFLVVYGLLLGVALGFVNGRNKDLGSTFVTALIIALLGWIPILGCIISWWAIKTRHDTGWGGAIVAWLLVFILAVVAIIVIALVAGISILGLIPFL